MYIYITKLCCSFSVAVFLEIFFYFGKYLWKKTNILIRTSKDFITPGLHNEMQTKSSSYFYGNRTACLCLPGWSSTK